MQAYQSPPCPTCGATWNQPGAQTCANCRNPLPPAQPSFAPPGYAPPSYPPPGYTQGPAYPQPPAGYSQPAQYPTFVPGAAAPSSQGSTTLNLFGQTITIPMVLPQVLVAQQKRIVYAITGVLALLLLLFVIAPALAAGQIAGAERVVVGTVADQAKVEAGFTSLFAANTATAVSDASPKELADFNALVTNTQSRVKAIQNKDSAGTKKYSGLVQAGLKLLAPLTNAITPAYEAKTYGSLQKGYEASIRALKN